MVVTSSVIVYVNIDQNVFISFVPVISGLPICSIEIYGHEFHGLKVKIFWSRQHSVGVGGEFPKGNYGFLVNSGAKARIPSFMKSRTTH